jgi:hypothetical protein
MINDKFYGYEVPETSSRLAISEEQLLKAKETEDESRHFHSFDKGCETEEQSRIDKKKHIYKVLFCKTHECDCHLDGWMIGAYGGTISKKLSNIPRCLT